MRDRHDGPHPPGDPTRSALQRMFRPRSVALLGASGRADSNMSRPLRYLAEQKFPGEVYPINPKYAEISGFPSYPSLADIPGEVDLVLAMVPAEHTPDAVRQAGAAGAAAVVVFASGFAETGAAGQVLQDELLAAAREAGVRVLGPNCQGVMYAPAGLAATFTAAAARPLPGGSGVAYVGQSGAIGGSVLDLAAERGIDLTAWVSTGNQADLDLVEVATHLAEDPAVDVVMLYAEAVRDGHSYERLLRTARDHDTRLVALVSGRSGAGRRAAVSHTGAMLSDDTALLLLSERYGVALVDDVDDLLAAAGTLRSVPGPVGRRVAVVTTSGGAGILAADHCERRDLVVPELAPATQERLRPLIPAFGAVANPVDVTAQLLDNPEATFGLVCSTAAADPDVDAVIVVLTMVTGEKAVRVATDLTSTPIDVPLVVVWMAGQEQTVDGRAIFAEAGVPVFPSVGSAVRAIAAMAPPAGSTDTPPAAADSSSGTPSVTPSTVGPAALDDPTGWSLLDALGIARPTSGVARSRPEAEELAVGFGAPVAVKLQAPGLAHKSDIGGVRLDVAPEAVGEVYDDMIATARRGGITPDGVLVQAMAPAGVELIVGATAARNGFPPVVSVGMGGTATEVYRDIRTALAPVDLDQARRMLRQLRGWPLLTGHRGRGAVDVDAAAEVVARVGQAVAGLSDHLTELEINPLVLVPGRAGASAVDVLLTRAAE